MPRREAIPWLLSAAVHVLAVMLLAFSVSRTKVQVDLSSGGMPIALSIAIEPANPTVEIKVSQTDEQAHHESDESPAVGLTRQPAELPVSDLSAGVPTGVSSPTTALTFPRAARPAPPDLDHPVAPPAPRETVHNNSPSIAAIVAEAAEQVPSVQFDSPPKTRPTNAAPQYPLEAWRRSQQGRVELQVEIDAQGSVTAVYIAATSGVPELDQAAVVTVRTWRFEPARLRGGAVPARVTIPVRFSLRNN